MTNQTGTKPTIVIVGIAQNCQPHLPDVLSNIDRISSLASDVGYVIVENDSIDGTKQILGDWGKDKSNFNLINMDGLNQIPIRTVKLEFIRNVCVQVIRSHETFSRFDYMVVMDMDDANVYQIDAAQIISSLEFLGAVEERAAVFANQTGYYYDMWAFRHPKLCPQDIWEELSDYSRVNKVNDQDAYDNTLGRRITSFKPDEEEIAVDSAFGGLGIYKMSYVMKNPNPYLGSKVKVTQQENGSWSICRLQVCEHVHFNAGIRFLGGGLFINPRLINGITSGSVAYNSAFLKVPKGLMF